MDLKRPVGTTFTVIILSIVLMLLTFFATFKNLTNKEFLKQRAREFDIVEYVKNRGYVIEHSNSYKYPVEVFDYINIYDFNTLMDQSIDNLYNDKDTILDVSKLTDLLTKSVNLYDMNNNTDSLSFVKEDISRFSSEISYKLNNGVTVRLVKSFISFIHSLIYYLPTLIAISLFALIFWNEKKNGLLINAAILFLYSFVIYRLDYQILPMLVSKGSFYSYINGLDKITLGLERIYIVCFILSFILLLIYIVMRLKKTIKNIRKRPYYG